jgi:hypothetical protein
VFKFLFILQYTRDSCICNSSTTVDMF